MPKKVKGTKYCPEDYNNATQCDSDDDPDICEEPVSPKISQAKGCDTYKKRQIEKTKKSTATPNSTKGGQTSPVTPLPPSPETSDAGKRKRARSLNIQSKLATVHAAQRKLQAKRARRANIFDEVGQIEEGLQANRDRITARLQAEEDDEITRPPRPYHRKSPSIIWKHCTKRINENTIRCNHCETTWSGLSGSTSNPLKHLRVLHYNMLSDEEKGSLPNNGATSGTNGVRRTLSKKIYEVGALARGHPSVKETDRKLAKVILSSCVSWSLIDNEAFGELCSELLGGRYNLPSRYYIQENVMTPMYEETKVYIKNALKKQVNIGLTTDAWTSTTQQSYITVTAHIIDEDCNLKPYVLDTTEITKRHTSENLMDHIKKILTEYEINTENESEHNIMYNYNTRWWSILIMMDRILTNYNAIALTLVANNKSSLILTPNDRTNMSAIVTLLKPFKECGEVLSSENDVTISLIVPYFQSLREHLSPKPDDLKIIEDMKCKMLLKLNNRYNTQQLKCLTFSTLLDVRHKNDLKDNFEQLKTALLNFLANQQEQQQSQNEIPATEGQQLENLSAIVRSHKKSIFAYKDDEVRDEPSEQLDAILYELNTYKNVRLSAAQKEKINVLSWWKNNKNQFPHLFQLVRSNLHIPATSVPSERIFSLAGYIVRDRRSKILSRNVNKAIFLKKNAKHIPPQTTVFSPPT